MARKRKGVERYGTIAISVDGPIPRVAPYKQGWKGRLFVPDDTRAWRRHIAANFKLAGGRKPYDDETVDVTYEYWMVRNHADLDSITHSAQDALSKDCLKADDKEWWGRYMRPKLVQESQKESIRITVKYTKKENDA